MKHILGTGIANDARRSFKNKKGGRINQQKDQQIVRQLMEINLIHGKIGTNQIGNKQGKNATAQVQ